MTNEAILLDDRVFRAPVRAESLARIDLR